MSVQFPVFCVNLKSSNISSVFHSMQVFHIVDVTIGNHKVFLTGTHWRDNPFMWAKEEPSMQNFVSELYQRTSSN